LLSTSSDAAYSADTAIKLILDTTLPTPPRKPRSGWSPSQRAASPLYLPRKYGSWLDLVEGFFSKVARSVPRHIRVASNDELRARILAYLDDLNREPVIHTWTYKIDTAV
jgi:hypothetical protein